MAGTGTNNTEKTIELTKIFQDLGADYGLVVTPYYNKPPQNALKAHFLTVADAVDLPLVLYNVPGRTGCNLQAETTLKLSAHPRIIGIKEASGDLNQIAKICLQRPQDFSVMSGDDNLTLPVVSSTLLYGLLYVYGGL